MGDPLSCDPQWYPECWLRWRKENCKRLARNQTGAALIGVQEARLDINAALAEYLAGLSDGDKRFVAGCVDLDEIDSLDALKELRAFVDGQSCQDHNT